MKIASEKGRRQKASESAEVYCGSNLVSHLRVLEKELAVLYFLRGLRIPIKIFYKPASILDLFAICKEK